MTATETPGFRLAQRADLEAIVAMLASDVMGRQRETAPPPLLGGYAQAFAQIDQDPNNELIVAELDGQLIATSQLTYIPNLTHRGSWRALIEAVRVADGFQGRRIGEQLMRFLITRAQARGCNLVQLTSDKQRRDAHRFYERLGFTASHEGYKLWL